MVHGFAGDAGNRGRPGASVEQAAAPGGREVALDTNFGNWQKALWRLLSDPTLPVVATLVVVMLATWFVLQDDAPHRGAFFLFGHR